MKTVIIDTNGFLRLFLNDIPKQADEIEKHLKQAQVGKIKIFIPQIIIFELQFALEKYYHFPKNEVIDKIKSLVSTEYIEVESQQVFISALTQYLTVNISFVDCFLVSQAKIEDLEIVTFDKKLKSLI